MKKGAYNETDILRIVEARHGKEVAAEIAKKQGTVAYKGFDIPLPDVVGYHQHNSECASDAIQEILLFADGIREYTQPILYGLTPEQIEVRSKIVLEFAQWERFSDYLTYIQKRFRSHYDVINYLRLHKIKPQNYYSKEEEVCELDPIFRRKKRESAEGGILALKKLKREHVYTESGMSSPLMKTTMESILKMFGAPYGITTIKDIIKPNAVGSTIVSTVSYAIGDGTVKTNTMRHATGFLKMLGEWYYYDNEAGIVKADKAIIEAFAEGSLYILTHKQTQFAKGEDEDNVITSVWKNGKWVSLREAGLTNAQGHIHKGTLILRTVFEDAGNCVFAALPDAVRAKYHGKCNVSIGAKNAAEFVETIEEFKECIYKNQDSNSLIFEDMYRYVYENIEYLRDNAETFDIIRKSSENVLKRSACTPMIHYWSYKIGAHLKELAANAYGWFEIPKLKDHKPRTPHNTPEFTRKVREELKKRDEEARKFFEKQEELKKLGPCPEGQVRDAKTKECRNKKKPEPRKKKDDDKNTNANNNTKKKKRSPCPPGQVRDTKTKKCRDRGTKPCPEGQVRDPKTKECRDAKKVVF